MNDKLVDIDTNQINIKKFSLQEGKNSFYVKVTLKNDPTISKADSFISVFKVIVTPPIPDTLAAKQEVFIEVFKKGGSRSQNIQFKANDSESSGWNLTQSGRARAFVKTGTFTKNSHLAFRLDLENNLNIPVPFSLKLTFLSEKNHLVKTFYRQFVITKKADNASHRLEYSVPVDTIVQFRNDIIKRVIVEAPSKKIPKFIFEL